MGKQAFSILVGKTISAITGAGSGSDEIRFTCTDGSSYRMDHAQGCCESVNVEDMCGDLADLIGEPVTLAEESTSAQRPSDLPPPKYEPESETWTFYRLGTRKGVVTIRWCGTSNGYYSESVDFTQLTPPDVDHAAQAVRS